jgi:hypothetical protein
MHFLMLLYSRRWFCALLGSVHGRKSECRARTLCNASNELSTDSPAAGAVPVTPITAHLTLYCFAVIAPSDDGGAVPHLGPLKGGPLSLQGVRLPSLAWRSRRPISAPKKLQNVMAITDVFALFWQSRHDQKRGTSMIPVILALGLAAGMALTTAFAFGLLPLLLI